MDDEHVHIIGNHFWNVKECSYVVNTRCEYISFSQWISISEQYSRETINSASHSWHISIFCGIFQSEVNITMTLEELNNENQILNIHHFGKY